MWTNPLTLTIKIIINITNIIFLNVLKNTSHFGAKLFIYTFPYILNSPILASLYVNDPLNIAVHSMPLHTSDFLKYCGKSCLFSLHLEAHQVHSHLSCLTICQFTVTFTLLYIASFIRFPFFLSFSFFHTRLFLHGAECVVMVIPICPECECVMSYWWDSVTVCQRHPSCLLNSSHIHRLSHTHILFLLVMLNITCHLCRTKDIPVHTHASILLVVNMLDSSHLERAGHTCTHIHTHILID